MANGPLKKPEKIGDSAAHRRALLEDGTMNVKDAVAFTGFGKSVIYEAMDDGTLPHVQRGRRKVIPRRALIEWLADRLVLA